MASFGVRFLTFIVTLHVVLFYGGEAGMITNQQGDNPNLKVIETFEDNEDLAEQGQVGDGTGILEDTFSPILAIRDLINSLIGIVAAPYTTISATPLPPFFQTLFRTLLGLFELITIYKIATGGL